MPRLPSASPTPAGSCPACCPGRHWWGLWQAICWRAAPWTAPATRRPPSCAMRRGSSSGARCFPDSAGFPRLPYLLAAPRPTGELLLMGCEAVIGAGGALLYGPALTLLHGAREDKREKPPNSAPLGIRRLGAAAPGLSLVLALSDFAPLFDISWGRMAAIYITLAAAYAAGPPEGCAVGLLTGLAADITLAARPGAALLCAAAGLTAGAVRRRGPLPAVILFTLTHGALLPWVLPTAALSALYTCFAAGVVWFLSARRVTEVWQRLLSDPALGPASFARVFIISSFGGAQSCACCWPQCSSRTWPWPRL